MMKQTTPEKFMDTLSDDELAEWIQSGAIF